MSRRPASLIALVVALASLGACADAATQPSRTIRPGVGLQNRAADSLACRTGWNSSTGRCG